MEKKRKTGRAGALLLGTAMLLAVMLPGAATASARELAAAVGLTLAQKWRLLGITREANRRYPSGKWPKFRERHFSGATLNQSALRAVFARRIQYRAAALSRIMYVNKRFYSNLKPEQKKRLVEQLKRDARRKYNKRRSLADYERRWFRVTCERMGVPAAKRPALEAARRRMARLRAQSFAAGRSHAQKILSAIQAGHPIDQQLVRMNRDMRARQIRVVRAKMHLLNLFTAQERRAVLADFTHMQNKRNL